MSKPARIITSPARPNGARSRVRSAAARHLRVLRREPAGLDELLVRQGRDRVRVEVLQEEQNRGEDPLQLAEAGEDRLPARARAGHGDVPSCPRYISQCVHAATALM